METKKVFEETEKLDNKLKELNKERKEINLGFAKMIEVCPHEIVFKFNDNSSRKMLIDKYFCPACGKALQITRENIIENTPFKESKVIPLNNLSLLGTNEDYQTIRNEVLSNFDMYYDPNANIEELSKRIEELLTETQYNFLSEKRLLKKK